MVAIGSVVGSAHQSSSARAGPRHSRGNSSAFRPSTFAGAVPRAHSSARRGRASPARRARRSGSRGDGVRLGRAPLAPSPPPGTARAPTSVVASDDDDLHALARRGGPGAAAAAEALLAAGWDPLEPDAAGAVPMHYAAARGHLDVVDALVRATLEMERDEMALDASNAAAAADDAIPPRGPSLLDAADANGQTPLYAAVAEGRAEIARRLVAAGADPRRRFPPDRSSLLHVAAARDRPDAARVLLSLPPRDDPDEHEHEHYSHEHYSHSHAHASRSRTKPKPKPKPSSPLSIHSLDRLGRTPARVAAEAGATLVLRVLADAGASFSASDVGLAAERRHFATTRAMIALGADPAPALALGVPVRRLPRAFRRGAAIAGHEPRTAVNAIAFHPRDRAVLAVAGEDGALRVYRVRGEPPSDERARSDRTFRTESDGAPSHLRAPAEWVLGVRFRCHSGSAGGCSDAAWSRAGDRVLTAGLDGAARAWALPKRGKAPAGECECDAPATCAAWGADDRVAWVATGRDAAVFDAAAGDEEGGGDPSEGEAWRDEDGEEEGGEGGEEERDYFDRDARDDSFDRERERSRDASDDGSRRTSRSRPTSRPRRWCRAGTIRDAFGAGAAVSRLAVATRRPLVFLTGAGCPPGCPPAAWDAETLRPLAGASAASAANAAASANHHHRFSSSRTTASSMRGCRLSGDETALATCDAFGRAYLWDARRGDLRRPVAVWRAHADGGGVADCAPSPEGDVVATCSEDGTARLFEPIRAGGGGGGGEGARELARLTLGGGGGGGGGGARDGMAACAFSTCGEAFAATRSGDARPGAPAAVAWEGDY